MIEILFMEKISLKLTQFEHVNFLLAPIRMHIHFKIEQHTLCDVKVKLILHIYSSVLY